METQQITNLLWAPRAAAAAWCQLPTLNVNRDCGLEVTLCWFSRKPPSPTVCTGQFCLHSFHCPQIVFSNSLCQLWLQSLYFFFFLNFQGTKRDWESWGRAWLNKSLSLSRYQYLPWHHELIAVYTLLFSAHNLIRLQEVEVNCGILLFGGCSLTLNSRENFRWKKVLMIKVSAQSQCVGDKTVSTCESEGKKGRKMMLNHKTLVWWQSLSNSGGPSGSSSLLAWTYFEKSIFL